MKASKLLTKLLPTLLLAAGVTTNFANAAFINSNEPLPMLEIQNQQFQEPQVKPIAEADNQQNNNSVNQEATTGTIRLTDIKGGVTITNKKTGQSVAGEEGMLLVEGFTISTPADSSLILVLSNGTTIYVGPNTVLEISSFTQTVDGNSPDSPVNEVNSEIGTSNIVLNLVQGTIYADVKPQNEGSSFIIQDQNVSTQVGKEGAQYSQSANGSSSTVDIQGGKVETKGANESTFSEKDPGEHNFSNGSPTTEEKKTEGLPSDATDRVNNAKQSNSAPAPVTPNQANQLPVVSATTQESQDTSTPSTTPQSETDDTQDPNNIKNSPDFQNPVTGDDIFNSSNFQQDPSNDIISGIGD